MVLVSTSAKQRLNLVSEGYDTIGFKVLRSVKGTLLIQFILKMHIINNKNKYFQWLQKNKKFIFCIMACHLKE